VCRNNLERKASHIEIPLPSKDTINTRENNAIICNYSPQRVIKIAL
jgi:hypothetical protein